MYIYFKKIIKHIITIDFLLFLFTNLNLNIYIYLFIEPILKLYLVKYCQ